MWYPFQQHPAASSYAGSIQQLHRGEVHILGHDVTTPEGMMEVGMKRRGSKRSIKAKSKLTPIRVQWKLVDPTFNPDFLGHHLRYKCSDWSGQGLGYLPARRTKTWACAHRCFYGCVGCALLFHEGSWKPKKPLVTVDAGEYGHICWEGHH